MQTVCLIGKPNVGKSTIFNRLIKEKKAIIMDTPGVTRDRIYGIVNLKEKAFHLIDTGGLTLENGDFNKEILMQGTLAIDEADIVLFVVDATMEISKADRMIASMLHKANKKVLVLVNKADNKERQNNLYNFYELGFEDIIAVSAEHNIGFDRLNEYFEKNISIGKEKTDERVKFCFVGRPNVGKSSLVNALLKEERLIVSDVAGTTRDAVDSTFKYNGEEYVVIDTAGMRKKGRIYEQVEKYSYIRSLKAIDRSDVCVLVIDAKEGIIEHDKHIASYITDAGKAIVICVNKWDTVENPEEELKKWRLLMENEFKFLSYAKVVFVSAKTSKRLSTLMPEIIKANENHGRLIATNLLNDCIMESLQMHNPPSYKGKRLKIYFTSQTSVKPPRFTFEVNNKKLVHFSYSRYLENQIRKTFELDGTPIILEFKNKND